MQDGDGASGRRLSEHLAIESPAIHKPSVPERVADRMPDCKLRIAPRGCHRVMWAQAGVPFGNAYFSNPGRKRFREIVKPRAARNGEHRYRCAGFSKINCDRATGGSGSDNRDIETHPVILKARVEQLRQFSDATQNMGMRLIAKPCFC